MDKHHSIMHLFIVRAFRSKKAIDRRTKSN